MPRYQLYADVPGWLPLLLLASCGDAAVPQEGRDAARPDAASVARDAAPVMPDAMPPIDACSCRGAGMATRIGSTSYAYQVVDGLSLGTSCDPQASNGQFSGDGELLGGSCVVEEGPNEHRAWLTMASPYWYHIFPRDSGDEVAFLPWFGSWRAPVRDVDHRMIITAACLLPAEAGAECARQAWVSYRAETALIAPQEALDLRVSCAEGVLVGGGCTGTSLAGTSRAEDDISLLRSGFAPDNRDEWLCSLVSEHEAEAEVMAVAFCLYESAPLPAECGCCPSLAESITIKQESQPLGSGSNRLEARCDEGQILAVGNCMLDSADVATVKGVRMFRSGYPPTPEYPDGDRSIWGCSWYNPTGNTPQAIATAVCLPE